MENFQPCTKIHKNEFLQNLTVHLKFSLNSLFIKHIAKSLISNITAIITLPNMVILYSFSVNFCALNCLWGRYQLFKKF